MPNDFIDFAWRARRTLSGIVRNRYWAVAGLAALSFFAFDWVRDYRLSVAKDAEWTFTGPACPLTVDDNLPPRRHIRYQEIEFGGNHYRRRFGHVVCTYVQATFRPVPVCQFTAPGELRVVTAKGTFNFTPGVGKKATVAVRKGVAQCVLAGKFAG